MLVDFGRGEEADLGPPDHYFMSKAGVIHNTPGHAGIYKTILTRAEVLALTNLQMCRTCKTSIDE